MATSSRYSKEQLEAFWALSEEGHASREIKRLCELGKAPGCEPFSPSDRSIRDYLKKRRKAEGVLSKPREIHVLKRSTISVLHAQVQAWADKLEKGEELAPGQVNAACQILKLEASPARGKTSKPKANGSGSNGSDALAELAASLGGDARVTSAEEAEPTSEVDSPSSEVPEQEGQASEHASTPSQGQAD